MCMLNEEIDAAECEEDATNNVRIILYIKRGKLIFVLINIKHIHTILLCSILTTLIT